MGNNDVFTFHLKKSVARGALYLLIFISMVDHAVTLIYDPEGRIERMRHQLLHQGDGKPAGNRRSLASKKGRMEGPCMAARERLH